MKCAKLSTGTSKRSGGEASTTAPTSSPTPAAEDTFVDSTAVVDPFGGAADVDPVRISALKSYCMMLCMILCVTLCMT